MSNEIIDRHPAVNKVIQYEFEDNVTSTVRILDIDEENNLVLIIEIDDVKKGVPKFWRLSDLIDELNSDIGKIITDPFATFIAEKDLTDKDKDIREKAWLIVEDVIKEGKGQELLDGKLRDKLFIEIAKIHKTTELTVRKYWRKHLQRGRYNKNALLPDYKNSGGAGKKRNITKKLGRKRKFAHAPEIGEGVNVSESMEQHFRAALDLYYYKKPGASLQYAYNEMIKDFFSSDLTYISGNLVSIPIEKSERPSYSQFYYFHEKEKSVEKEVETKKGKGKYNLNYRPVLGNATSQVFGPGSRYEIDATVADVYLVSAFNSSWIIGRPVVYIVIDVFTRMIVGVYVGLEGPSWLGAMMALANVVTDKVAFCKEYDISIEADQWSAKSLPETLLADGGEIAGKSIEKLSTNFRIRIETTPPYRADLKGIVERYFRTIQDKVQPFIPGWVIKDFDKRRGPVYQLDARLTIYQFTKIIIHSILRHNNGFLPNYDRSAEMIKDNVAAIPREIWKWGIKNQTGMPPHFDEDIVRLNLLPSDEAIINRSGINFKGMKYSCDRAIRERWFEEDSPKAGKVEVVYDKRKPDYIYLLENKGRGYEKCYLMDHQEKYVNKDFYDIEFYQDYEKFNKQLYDSSKPQEFAEDAAFIGGIVDQAEQKALQDFDPDASKSSRTSNISENRQNEKEFRRKKEAFEIGERDKGTQATVLPFKQAETTKSENVSSEDEDFEMFEQVRKDKSER